MSEDGPSNTTSTSVRSIVYFDIVYDEGENARAIGRIVIQLYDDIVPKTAENFSAFSFSQNAQVADRVAFHFSALALNRGIMYWRERVGCQRQTAVL